MCTPKAACPDFTEAHKYSIQIILEDLELGPYHLTGDHNGHLQLLASPKPCCLNHYVRFFLPSVLDDVVPVITKEMTTQSLRYEKN